MNKYSLSVLSLLLTASASGDERQGKREVILDNKDVEVVRLTYPAGAQSGMHTHHHPFRVVYFVKGGKLLLQPDNPNAPDKVLDVTEGQTLYLPATTHNVKNIGTTEVVIVETEIKNSAMGQIRQHATKQ